MITEKHRQTIEITNTPPARIRITITMKIIMIIMMIMVVVFSAPVRYREE